MLIKLVVLYLQGTSFKAKVVMIVIVFMYWDNNTTNIRQEILREDSCLIENKSSEQLDRYSFSEENITNYFLHRRQSWRQL